MREKLGTSVTMNPHDLQKLKQAKYTNMHIQILSGLPEAILKQFLQDLDVFKKTNWQPETFIFLLKDIAAIKDLPQDFKLMETLEKNYSDPYQCFFKSLKDMGYSEQYIQELKNLPFHFSIILLRKYNIFVDAKFSMSELLLSLVGTMTLSPSDLIGAEKQLLELIQQLEKDAKFKEAHITRTLAHCLTVIFCQMRIPEISLNDLVASIIENDISYEVLWLLKNNFPIEYFLPTSMYHLKPSKIIALFDSLIPLKTDLNLDDASIYSIVSLAAGAKRLEQVANSIHIFKRYELPKQQIIDLFTGHQDDTFFEGPTLAARLLLTISEEHSPSFCAIKEDTDQRLNVLLSSDPYPPKKKKASNLTFFSPASAAEKPANQGHWLSNPPMVTR
jgi:hypothetical protein